MVSHIDADWNFNLFLDSYRGRHLALYAGGFVFAGKVINTSHEANVITLQPSIVERDTDSVTNSQAYFSSSSFRLSMEMGLKTIIRLEDIVAYSPLEYLDQIYSERPK